MQNGIMHFETVVALLDSFHFVRFL